MESISPHLVLAPPKRVAATGFRRPLVLLLLSTLLCQSAGAQNLGEMDLTVLDAETKQPLAVRLRMTDIRDRSPRIRGVPRLGNDFTFRDQLTFKMRLGTYKFIVEHGPQYKQLQGTLKVKRDGFDVKELNLPRFADLRSEGWYSGDLLVARKRDELELLLEAEDLDVGVLPGWKPLVEFKRYEQDQARTQVTLDNAIHSTLDASAGMLSSPDGRLLAAHVQQTVDDPLAVPATPLQFAKSMRARQAHVALLDAAHPDLPMLIAHEVLDSIAILNDAQRHHLDDDQHRGRQPTEARFRIPGGVGRYAQEIYFRLLNCGIRIAPSAISGSGVCKNPPGYNRVYVACGEQFYADTFWAQLKAGRSFISNGPLLRVRVNKQLPGHQFSVLAGDKIELDVACNLATRQKVDYLEIIKDGLVEESVRLEEWAANNGHLPLITFDRSGWLLVRAVVTGGSGERYQYAMTAPFYVQVGETACADRKSAKFFADWVVERARQVRKLSIPDEVKQQQINGLRFARDFWQRRLQLSEPPPG